MITFTVAPSTISFFQQQAQQKIAAEKWGKDGRPTEIKIKNFVQAWITEEAFKQILIQRGKWFNNRALYFGDAKGAGPDFMVKINGEIKTLGIRSINDRSYREFKTVAYPNDRFEQEQDKIAEYHVACHAQNGTVSFLGLISKAELLQELAKAERKYSRQNQEYFRTVPLHNFSIEQLTALLQKIE